MINFEWYRTFKAIYRKGTLTGAAQELYISQPNVGQHLAALEAYVGKSLFDRQHRKMVPTDYGKLLYTQLIEAIEKLEQTEAQFRFTHAGEFPMLFIGTAHEFFNVVMADKAGESNANFIFEFGNKEELTEKLLSDSLSFAFTSTQINHRNLTSEPLFREDFVLVGPADIDTQEFDQMAETEDLAGIEQWLMSQSWLAYSSNLLIIRRFWLNNFKKRPIISPRFIIPTFIGMLKTMTKSGGVTIAPDYMLEDFLTNGHLKIIWRGFTPSHNHIFLSYNQKKVSPQQIELVRSLAKQSKD